MANQTNPFPFPSNRKTIPADEFLKQPLPLACIVIPARAKGHMGEEKIGSLDVAMQSLAPNKHSPVALEIAGTGTRKMFILRASKRAALQHLKMQIRSRYPQASLHDLQPDKDPFQLKASETATVIELLAGAPSYLPMLPMDKHTQFLRGTDPILGILAALDTLPAGTRAITQIALVPAPPTWSIGHQRKAVEHPLEGERFQRQRALSQSRTGSETSTSGTIGLVLIALMLFAWYRFHNATPSWLQQLASDIFLHGRTPVLSEEHQVALLSWGGLGLLTLIIMLFTITTLKRRFFQRALYDQRLVSEKTSSMAYHVRIRCYVIGAKPTTSYAMLITRLAHHIYAQGIRYGKNSVAWLIPSLQATPYQMQHPPSEERPLPPIVLQDFIHAYRLSCYLRQQHMDILESLAAAYRQFDTASAGYFHPKTLNKRTAIRLLRAPSGQQLPAWSHNIATSPHYQTGTFLAHAWKLPHAAEIADLPLMQQKRARTLLVPPDLMAPAGAPLIGYSEHGGYRLGVALPAGFFSNHSLICGKSGEGKSTLLRHITLQAIGRGATCVFDPHGDVSLEILRSVPPEQLNNVVFIDLGDPDFCVGINPLDRKLGRDRDLTVASLVSIFSKYWDTSWGPRMEAPFRYAVLLLLEVNALLCQQDPINGPLKQYTLLDVMQVLTDENFCLYLLSLIDDPFIARFWHTYFHPLDNRQQQERIDPVITKMSQFETKVARRIIGQSKTTIDFNEVIAQQKTLIVRLAASESGAQTASLIGATLLGLLMVSTREQSIRDVQERNRLTIICDEFQTIKGGDWEQLTTETRKFGISAILATQSPEYINQMKEAFLSTVLAGVKQFFLFKMSAADSELMAANVGVESADLINLDSYMCYASMIAHNQQQPTFSLQLERPSLGSDEVLDALRAFSRQHYSRSAEIIEQELIEAMARNIGASQSQARKKRATAPPEGFPEPPHASMPEQDNASTATENPPLNQNPPRASKQPPFSKQRDNRPAGKGDTGTQKSTENPNDDDLNDDNPNIDSIH